MARVDVTIMGAGIFGLAIAYACCRRGARVRVIDRQGIGAGSSGGIVGALAPHTPENWNEKKAFQFESLIGAQAFWAGVDGLSGGSSGYARCGRLQAVPNARALALARARTSSAAELWQGLADWTVEPIDAGRLWAPVSPSGWLIRDSLSARLHPRRACESLAGAVRALGGEIIIGSADASGAVVWATGADGLARLSEATGREIGNGVKGQALLLACDPGDVPQIYADGVHVVPHDDGTVAVGSTTEREFDVATATDSQLDTLHARAVAICPALQDAEVVGRWAGVRPRARTRAPILGEWPDRPGHFVANGGFKIGFGIAPGIGKAMADLVLDRQATIPDGFRVSANL